MTQKTEDELPTPLAWPSEQIQKAIITDFCNWFAYDVSIADMVTVKGKRRDSLTKEQRENAVERFILSHHSGVKLPPV